MAGTYEYPLNGHLVILFSIIFKIIFYIVFDLVEWECVVLLQLVQFAFHQLVTVEISNELPSLVEPNSSLSIPVSVLQLAWHQLEPWNFLFVRQTVDVTKTILIEKLSIEVFLSRSAVNHQTEGSPVPIS